MAEPISKRPLLLGHRGCRGAFAENTISAFEHALASGCDGFEFDVRTTSDQNLVIVHDPKHRGRHIATNTYAGLHERRRWIRTAQTEPPIAQLAEMLFQFSERAWLDVEIKVAGVERSVVELLHKFRPAKGFVVSSFLPEVLQAVYQLDQAMPLGYIFKTREQAALWPAQPGSFVMPHYKLLNERSMKEFRDAGKTVLTWTVNEEAEMKRVAALGVDGIIADDPVLLRRALGR